MNFNLRSIRKLYTYFLKMGYICLLAGLPACNLLAYPTADQIKNYIMTNIVGNDQSAKEMVQQCGLKVEDIKGVTEQLFQAGVLNSSDKRKIMGGRLCPNSCTKQLQQLFNILNIKYKFDVAWKVISTDQRVGYFARDIEVKINTMPWGPPSRLSQMACDAPVDEIRSQLNGPATLFLTYMHGVEPDWPMIGRAVYSVRRNHQELMTLLKKNSHDDRVRYLAEILRSASALASESPNYPAADIMLKLHELVEHMSDSDFRQTVRHVVFTVLRSQGITDFEPFRQYCTRAYASPQEYCEVSGIISDFFTWHAEKFKGLYFNHFREISGKLEIPEFPFSTGTLENLIRHLHNYYRVDNRFRILLSLLSQADSGETGMGFVEGMAGESKLKKKIISVVTEHGTDVEQRCILLLTNGRIAPGAIQRQLPAKKPCEVQKQTSLVPQQQSLAAYLSTHHVMTDNLGIIFCIYQQQGFFYGHERMPSQFETIYREDGSYQAAIENSLEFIQQVICNDKEVYLNRLILEWLKGKNGQKYHRLIADIEQNYPLSGYGQ